MANDFPHIELNTSDPKKASEFYKKIFKWKLKVMKGMNYTMIDAGSKHSGGGITTKMDGAPTQWVPYVNVDNVKATLVKAEQNGARVVQPYMELPDMGAIGVFIDPTGAALGIWGPADKPAKKAKPAKKKKKK